MTFARLDAFAHGQIVGLRQAGKERGVIQKFVKTRDGSHPALRAVDAVLRKKRDHPQWRGDDSRAGGRPRALTSKQVKELVALVFAERGKAVVTVPYCCKRLPFLREVHETLSTMHCVLLA